MKEPRSRSLARDPASEVARSSLRLARATIDQERTEDWRARAVAHDLAHTRVIDAPKEGQAGPPPRRALLIINAKSGRKADGLLQVREIAESLGAYGIRVDARIKLRKSVARQVARRAAKKGYQLVIAAGGDGTVAAVASGLVGTDATLGIIPLGTYNNTATSLGIPLSVQQACALIAVGPQRLVDVGEVRAAGRRKPALFLESAAVGMAASLTSLGQHMEKGRWEDARALMPTVLAMEPTLAKIKLDRGRPPQHARTLLILIANGPRSGAGLEVSPLARLDDGLFDVHVYEDLDQAGLTGRAVVSRGDVRSIADAATHGHARSLRVETLLPLPVLADSKVVGATPARFRLRAGALRVIAGDGAGLNRPVADQTFDTVRAIARLATPEPSAPTHEPAIKGVAKRALAEVVPAMAQMSEQLRSAPRSAVPVAAAAALASVLLASLVRRRSNG